MRAYHLAAFLALGFFQAAPVRFPAERFRLAVAGATGQWEDYQEASFDCEGNQTSPEESTPVAAGSVGARADAFFAAGRGHVSLVAGKATSDVSPGSRGSFWGTEAGWDWQSLGVSVGIRDDSNPFGRPVRSRLSLSVRGGRFDGVHYRVEFQPLSETPSLAGDARMGAVFGQGEPRRPSGFFGLVVGSSMTSDAVPVAGFADFSFPFGRTADVLARGVFGPGHLNPNWGVGVGLRARWGR